MYEDYDCLLIETWLNEFQNNQVCLKYLSEYLAFIKKAITRYDDAQYGEYHHVIPRCIDTDSKYVSQVVKISGSDHFLAHCKLISCFEDVNLKYKLSCAVHYMYPRTTESEEIAEAYQSAREAHSILLKDRLTGRKLSKETIDKMKVSQKERYKNPEMRHQLSLAHKGYRFSETARENMSKANKGSNNPMYGKHHSPETILKMNESRELRGYNLVCKVCGNSFKSHAPNTKRCDLCR